MRKIVRATLIVALGVLAVAVAITAWSFLGPSEGGTWATIAAALAVIASLTSTWNGQRVLELQEDARQPFPYPSIDVESRYRIMQLRVTNYGGGLARGINLEWNDNPLLDIHGQPVGFTKQEGAPDVAVLLPEQSVATYIGLHFEIFDEYENMNYSGHLEFKNASGKTMRHSFYLSAEQYRNTLTHDEEGLKTHHRLQQIPNELKKLSSELRKFRP